MLDITKPVWTRDGRPARIVCSDLKRDDGRTLIVTVDFGTWEDCRLYYPNGRNRAEDDPSYNGEDLTNDAPTSKETPREPIVPDASFDVLNERLADIETTLEAVFERLGEIDQAIRFQLGQRKKRNPRK